MLELVLCVYHYYFLVHNDVMWMLLPLYMGIIRHTHTHTNARACSVLAALALPFKPLIIHLSIELKCRSSIITFNSFAFVCSSHSFAHSLRNKWKECSKLIRWIKWTPNAVTTSFSLAVGFGSTKIHGKALKESARGQRLLLAQHKWIFKHIYGFDFSIETNLNEAKWLRKNDQRKKRQQKGGVGDGFCFVIRTSANCKMNSMIRTGQFERINWSRTYQWK